MALDTNLLQKEMKPLVILHGISAEDLSQIIEKAVEQKFQEIIAEHIKPRTKIHYLTRKEVAELLRISLPTLNDWTKEGLVKSYRIGNRILYRSDEVNASLTSRRFFRRS